MQRVAAHRACGLLYRFVRQYRGVYLLPANVCPVVPLTLCTAGVPFEFVDINPETLCIDEHTCLEKMKSDLYAGVICVRTYGYVYNADKFFEVVHQLGKKVIDDRCLCMPELDLEDAKADMVLYSTGYAKYVDLGEGAFAYLQDNTSLTDETLDYKGIDIEEYYKPLFHGGKKFTMIPNGWLDIQLGMSSDYFDRIHESLTKVVEHKQRINDIYQNNLPSSMCMASDKQNWRFNIRVNDKARLLRAIFDSGGFASSHYQPSSRLFTDERFVNAEKLYGEVINLFNDKYISVEQATSITNIIGNEL